MEKLGKIDHGLSKVPWLKSASDISVNVGAASFGKLDRMGSAAARSFGKLDRMGSATTRSFGKLPTTLT